MVGNPEVRLSRVDAHLSKYPFKKYKIKKKIYFN